MSIVLNSSLPEFVNTAIDERQEAGSLKPIVFHKHEWLQIPCYFILGQLAKIYGFAVQLFTASLFLFSEETKRPLYRHIKKASLQGDYWIDHKMLNIFIRHKFQNHFVQKTYNRPQLEVFLEEKDLQVAKKLYDETREKCRSAIEKRVKRDVLNEVNRGLDRIEKTVTSSSVVEEIKPLINKEEDSELLKSKSEEIDKLISSVSQGLFRPLEIIDFKSALGGVCAMAVIHAAYEHLHNNKSWFEIAATMSEGVNELISGAQAIQATLGDGDLPKTILFHELNISSTKLDTIPFRSTVIDELSCEKFDKLGNGTYFLSLQCGDGAHAILLHRESEEVHIIDPNFGLFRSAQNESKTLLKDVLKMYPLQSIIISKLECKEYTDDQIVEGWESVVNGRLEWTGSKYYFLG